MLCDVIDMIDCHAHLCSEIYEKAGKNAINLADQAFLSGVSSIIINAFNEIEIRRVLRLVRIFAGKIFMSIGAVAYNTDEDYVLSQINLIKKYRRMIVAIGEVGLDYYRSKEKELQIKNFKSFISLSEMYGLPLIVHSRSAGKYAIDILIEEKVDDVLMHAFDGKASVAMKGASHGFLFSIPPRISPQREKLIKRLPLENLLLESDAPALAPVKGELNYPENIRISAMLISKIKNISLEKVIDTTTENTKKLFKIP